MIPNNFFHFYFFFFLKVKRKVHVRGKFFTERVVRWCIRLMILNLVILYVPSNLSQSMILWFYESQSSWSTHLTYFYKHMSKNRRPSHFIKENTWVLGWELAFCFLTASFQQSISFYRQYQSLRKHNAIKGSNNGCLITVMGTLPFGDGTKAPWDPDTDLKGILLKGSVVA